MIDTLLARRNIFSSISGDSDDPREHVSAISDGILIRLSRFIRLEVTSWKLIHKCSI